MTDLEMMRHVKTYVDKLARGIDPLTDREVPEGEVINNVRISRCLYYISDVLQQVIENGGVVAKTVKNSEKVPFSLSLEKRSRYSFGERPVTVSVITQRLNELIDQNIMKRLTNTSITGFLLQAGLLFEESGPSGSRNKRPTDAGRSLGITTDRRMGQNGEYTAVIYNREAQQFILDNLDAVMAINDTPRYKNQGKRWEPEEDAYLQEAFRVGRRIREMSDALGRSRDAIRARLDRLGHSE